jgi:hypothetical protein
MANTLVQIRKLFERRLERTQEEGATVPDDSQGLWVALGLYLVADALSCVSTSIDNLASETRDCNDGVAQALQDIDGTLTKVIDSMEARPER